MAEPLLSLPEAQTKIRELERANAVLNAAMEIDRRRAADAEAALAPLAARAADDKRATKDEQVLELELLKAVEERDAARKELAERKASDRDARGLLIGVAGYARNFLQAVVSDYAKRGHMPKTVDEAREELLAVLEKVGR